MLLPDQRTAVLACCQQLLATGLVRGTSGNVSVRERDSGTIAISPTGVGYSQLSAADIVVLDPSGRQLDGRLRPTSELALHLGLYQARPELGAVVHTHSMFATTFAVLGEALPPVHYLIARAGGEVPVAPYARYGSPELAESCVRTLAGGGAVLLANHGVVAVGTSLAQAMEIAEAVEFVAELAWRARLAGSPRLLDEAQLAQARSALSSYGRQPDG
ncbi:MAG: class II aldolase/adducin family protein [Jatrophihabitans sp.]